jgi:DnaK suppressor protein
VVVIKSAAPAAKFPPIHPDDEFIGIDKLTDGEFIAQQVVMLGNARATALGQANMFQAEADQIAAEMEPGDVQFDDESGEGASASMEREKDLAMAAEKLIMVEDIERAMIRLENQVYGHCTNCHKPIPRMRLRALPQATLCIECKNGGLSRRS